MHNTVSQNVVCKNCDNSYHGNFCNMCGQSAHTHAINWHYVVHDVQHGVFHVDKGILYTLKELVLRPGQTIRHFIKGKRVDYFKPSALVFILATLYGFLYHYFDINEMFIQGTNKESQAMQQSMQQWVTSHYALVILATIPFYALGSFIFFRKSGYNFIEHLVVNLYLGALKLALQIVLFPFLYMSQGSTLMAWALTISMIADIVLLCYVFGNLFNMYSKAGRVIRAICSYLLGNVFVMVLVIAITVIYMIVTQTHT